MAKGASLSSEKGIDLPLFLHGLRRVVHDGFDLLDREHSVRSLESLEYGEVMKIIVGKFWWILPFVRIFNQETLIRGVGKKE